MKKTVQTMLMLLVIMLMTGCAQKIKLDELVEQENTFCPYELEDGVSIDKVELKTDNTVVFFISLDDTYGSLLDDKDGKVILKDGMLHWFTDGDSPFKELVDAVITLDGSIGCDIQNTEGKNWKCEFWSSDLEMAREENADINDSEDETEVDDNDEDTDDAEAIDFESLASSDDVDLDNMSDSMKELMLKQGIKEAGKQMPMELGDGLTMKSVKLVDYNLIYTIDIDESNMDIETLKIAKDEMKKAMIAMVKEGDSDMQFLCRLLAETNRGMDFKYKGNDSGKSLTIHLTKGELKRALGL